MDYTWGPTRRIERVAKIAAWFHQAPSGLAGRGFNCLGGGWWRFSVDLAEPVVKDDYPAFTQTSPMPGAPRIHGATPPAS